MGTKFLVILCRLSTAFKTQSRFSLVKYFLYFLFQELPGPNCFSMPQTTKHPSVINMSFFYVSIWHILLNTSYFKKQRLTSQRNLHVVPFCITGIHSFSETKKVAILITKIFKDIAEEWPSPPGTFHILIGKFSYLVIRFLNQTFLSLPFPISLSDFYLIAL